MGGGGGGGSRQAVELAGRAVLFVLVALEYTYIYIYADLLIIFI